jgi:predicted methyltransferase
MPYIGNVSPFESVGTSDLEDGSVTAAKVVDGAITAAKINSAVALGGPSLGTNSVIRTNAKVIAENITFAGTENGMTIGPITVNSGYTVTVASGSTWVVL